MKRIINGKKYNTETAVCVSEWKNTFDYLNFKYCKEELYQKENGEFFLYGVGGHMSRYGERCGDSMASGEVIIPLTLQGTKEWVEKKDNDRYEELFGVVEE